MKKITKEFKDKTVAELEKQVQSIREEIAKAKLNFKANLPKDTNVLVKKRKQLAVLLTVLTEKKDYEKNT